MNKATESDRPLCRNYRLVLVQPLALPSYQEEGAPNMTLVWALGVVGGGAYESLGVWHCSGEDAATRQSILAELKLRGTEEIGCVLDAGSHDVDRALVPGRTILASHRVADGLQRLASRAVKRHGPFASAGDAVSFVADALSRAEQRLGDISVEQAARRLAGRVSRRASKRNGAHSLLVG